MRFRSKTLATYPSYLTIKHEEQEHMRDYEKETKLASERLSKIYQIVKQDNHHKFISLKPMAILGMTPPRCRQVKLPILR
jgi:hypothetical protein